MWGDSKSKFIRKKVKKDGELSSSSSLGDLIDLSSASQDIGDKMIEVIGLENCLHMGQVTETFTKLSAIFFLSST